MNQRTDNVRAPDGRSDGSGSKRNLLVLSVAGITVLIVLLWAMIVPAQLGSFSLFSEEDQRGWAEIKAATDAQNEEFQRALGEMRDSLEAVAAEAEEEEESETEITPEPAIAASDIAELRARLEAKSTTTQSEPDDNGQQETP